MGFYDCHEDRLRWLLMGMVLLRASMSVMKMVRVGVGWPYGRGPWVWMESFFSSFFVITISMHCVSLCASCVNVSRYYD